MLKVEISQQFVNQTYRQKHFTSKVDNVYCVCLSKRSSNRNSVNNKPPLINKNITYQYLKWSGGKKKIVFVIYGIMSETLRNK